MNLTMKHMNKKRIIWIVAAVAAVAVGAWLVLGFSAKASNPWNAATVGEIPAPIGYKRVDAPKGGYAEYLRSLPLKPRGSKVQLFTGGDARLQCLSAAVINMKMLSNYEQCADMTMRIRAEYFYKHGRYGEICFTDVNGRKQRYQGGGSRKAFEDYLRRVYGICSTFSVHRETKPRALKEVQPGDVLVYKARPGRKYGHAILVVDVARSQSGKIAVMCAEGNTPAREAHVLRNSANPIRNPWFILDEDDKNIWISGFRFNADELRHY